MSPSQSCDLCHQPDHTIDDCEIYIKARLMIIQEKKSAASLKPSNRTIRTEPYPHSSFDLTANYVPPVIPPSEDSHSEDWTPIRESAGSASALIVDPSDPTSPLIADANFRWNTDTGATSHMCCGIAIQVPLVCA